MVSTSTTANNNVNNHSTNLNERTYVSAEIFYFSNDDDETLTCSEFITSVTFNRRYYADDVQSLSNDATIGFSVLEPSQKFFVPFFDAEPESKLASVLRSLLSGFGPFENLYWKDPELGYDNATALGGTDAVVARVLSFAADMVRTAETREIVVPGKQRIEMRVTVERRIVASLRFFEHPLSMDRSVEPGVVEEENSSEARHREVEETLTRDLEELQYTIIREEEEDLNLDWEEHRSRYKIVVQTLVRALDELQLWLMTMERTVISDFEDRGLGAEQEEILLVARRMVWILVQLREAIQLWLSESDQTLVRAREEYRSRLGLGPRASPEDTIRLVEVMMDDSMTSESNNDDDIYLRERPAKKSAVDELEKSRFDGDVDDRSKTLTCVICIQDVLAGSEITWMPCSHGFHSDCILKWLEKSYTCPMCRYGLPTND